MKPIKNSSNLASAKYDETAQTLDVVFTNGTTYRYSKVPSDVYKDFESTFEDEKISTGKHFNSNIKSYPYEKL